MDQAANLKVDQRIPPTIDFKPTNAKDAEATSRLDITLLPPAGIAYGALAMVEGDLKYGGYNYREKGVMASVYIAAMFRHALKYLNGEDADPKTGVPHLGSIIACASILADATEQGNLNDDRPPAQRSDLFESMEKRVKHLQQIIPRQTSRYREKN